MQFSVCFQSNFEIFIFGEKCKQTAEISWLFFWDVKISKKVINKNFVIFHRDVKTYLSLCSPSTQREISHLPNIHVLLFVFIFKQKIPRWIFQLILHLWIPIWIEAIGIWISPNNKAAKLGYLAEQKKSKFFCSDTDGNLIVAGHRYNLFMFTL